MNSSRPTVAVTARTRRDTTEAVDEQSAEHAHDGHALEDREPCGSIRFLRAVALHDPEREAVVPRRLGEGNT